MPAVNIIYLCTVFSLFYIHYTKILFLLATSTLIISESPIKTAKLTKIGKLCNPWFELEIALLRQNDKCISPDGRFYIVIDHFKVYKMVSKKTANIRFQDHVTSKSKIVFSYAVTSIDDSVCSRQFAPFCSISFSEIMANFSFWGHVTVRGGFVFLIFVCSFPARNQSLFRFTLTVMVCEITALSRSCDLNLISF